MTLKTPWRSVRMDYDRCAVDDARFIMWGPRNLCWHIVTSLVGDEDDYSRRLLTLCGKSTAIVQGDVSKLKMTADDVENSDLCQGCELRIRHPKKS